MKRLLQRSTIKPLEKRGTGKSSFILPLLDSNLRKHLQWESSSTLIPRCHFQQKTVAMMLPSVIAPPAMYPNFLRPSAALSLPPTLQSAFTTHSSFLVEDLLRISRPATFMHRSIQSPSVSPPATGATNSEQLLHSPRRPCLHHWQKDQALHKHQFQTTQITWSLEWMRFSRQQHETVGLSFVYKPSKCLLLIKHQKE